MRVSPFGNPRVDGYFLLAAAYRRLSRPSSALSAKAFTLRSFSLEQPFCFFSIIFQFGNKFSFFAWASQIIVLGCELANCYAIWRVIASAITQKTLIGFIIHVSCPPEEYIYSPSDEIVLEFFQLHPLVYGKTFKNNFLTSFSQYTTICFVSLYFIRFSMSICLNSFEFWWRWWDSNPWPPACRAGALPAELHPHLLFG